MPLISVTAGSYNVYYGSTLDYLGVLDDNGVEISWTLKANLVNKTDGYADTLINGFHTGADFRMRFVCQEFPYDTDAQTGYTALDANWGGIFSDTDLGLGPQPGADPPGYYPARVPGQAFGFLMPTIGGEFDQTSLPIVLNADGGTSASNSFTTLTALSTIPRSNQQRAIRLTSKIRIVPVELDLLPYFVTDGPFAGQNSWFSVT